MPVVQPDVLGAAVPRLSDIVTGQPSVEGEAEWGGDRFTPAAQRKRVLLAGGCPAGLEAARVAAERGHEVVLAEAFPRLGDAFRLAGEQPRRGQIVDLLDWCERQLAALGVDLRLATYLDSDDIAAVGADHVILATGALPAGSGFQKALPACASLPGIELGGVHSVEQLMARQLRLG